MILHRAVDPGAAAGALIATWLKQALDERGRATLAIPGGRSPVGVLRWLAEHLDGHGVILTFVDERHLPLPETPGWQQLPAASNLRLAWQHWLSRTASPPAVVPLARPGTLEKARACAAEAVAALLPLDVALVGFGEDGHIASLFPDHPALSGTEPVLAVADSPKPPPERLTLSLTALQQTRQVLLLVPSVAKARVLAAAWSGGQRLPVALLDRTRLHVVASPQAHPLLQGVFDVR